jgi:Zn finger protein HypA/HybF involved in hydrogenase expression
MKHMPAPRVRSSTVRNIDPVLTISQDIAKFVVDWAHITKIKKIDEIGVHIEGTNMEEEDLKEMLTAVLMETAGEKAKISVKKERVKHLCHEHHVTFEKKCPICGLEGIKELPKIKVQIKAKGKKAEIQI